MLGIGCPDRHALPRVTPIKCTDRELRSPPARAGSFFGASRPLRRIPAIAPFCPYSVIARPVKPFYDPRWGGWKFLWPVSSADLQQSLRPMWSAIPG